ncbi:MAG: DPP IV N-terminal domain-containing protein, partial [Acidobacteriota bacterium]|nr:DPP IV N-terminal domain-containing protein [Acidobacteriota bacterium]
RPGQNLWRMDLDGGNPRQLTSGNSDYGAAVSPDSKWVIYNSNISGRPALWKVSIDGGDPVQLTEYAAENPEVSPDGTLIACQYREATNSPWRYAIIPYDGGKPLKIFDLAADNEGDIRWSPDGRLLTYANLRNGVSNIWGFPLDGSPPKQLTDFKADYIYNFKWSPDGKQLVLARGTTTSDVVLIKDFR